MEFSNNWTETKAQLFKDEQWEAQQHLRAEIMLPMTAVNTSYKADWKTMKVRIEDSTEFT